MAIELATAYVSLVPETSKFEKGLRDAFDSVGKNADKAGKDAGTRIAKTASKALRDGWKPDQFLTTGSWLPNMERVGARIGQAISKGVSGGLKDARRAGKDFGQSFASGAGSVGLGSVISGWHSDLKGQSSKLGFVAGKALSAGMQTAAAAGLAGVGFALKSGFDRLVTLDTAQYKLKQILKSSGRDAKDFDKINKAVQNSVDKTPFSLDQAFGTAVMAIGAGTKDIEKFMQSVSDAAGFAGTDMERMGIIFTQVLAKGKLTGEETMQLMEAGLPAKSWIADSYKLTSDQFDQMQAKGQISLDMLQKSIEDHAPGMAKALGNTLQGSIDNMKTAFTRTGANLLAALFGGETGDPTEGLKGAVQRATEMLNRFNAWIVDHKDEIKNFFDGAKDVAGGLLTVIEKISTTLGEHPNLIKAVVGAFVAWKTIEGVAALTKTLGAINTLLGVTLPASATLGAAGITKALASISIPTAIAAIMYYSLKDDPTWGNKGTVGNGGGIVAPLLGGWGRDGYMGGNVSSIGGSSAGLKPNAAALRASIAAAFPQIGDIGGYRANDKYPDHPSGNAIDVMIPKELVGTEAGKALGDSIVAYAMQSGVTQYALWQQQNWKPGQAPIGMEDRGTPTENHIDHVHIYTTGPALSPAASAPSAVVAPSVQNPVSGGGGDIIKRLSGLGGTYDTGGWLPNGTQLVTNDTGKPELILNPDQQKNLADQGIDPQALLHGASGGAAPGPNPPGAQVPAAGGPDNTGLDFIRSMGFIPAAAGSSGVAGTSSLSGFINMGNSVVSGIIDTGVNLANQAVSAAIMAGAAGGGMGAGAAAAPLADMAASYGIQLAGNQAKRVSQWGFQMLGIGADALVEQLSPFGTPRWLGYDYTNFAPQLGIQQALTSTVEKMGSNAINQAFPQGASPYGPVTPATMSGGPASSPLTPAPEPDAGPNMNAAGPSQDTTAPPPKPDLLAGLFDKGGYLPPGGIGVNLTSQPEPVLTPQQWNSIAAGSSTPSQGGPLVQNLYAQDMQDAIRQLEKVKRRDMMQYAGRP